MRINLCIRIPTIHPKLILATGRPRGGKAFVFLLRISIRDRKAKHLRRTNRLCLAGALFAQRPVPPVHPSRPGHDRIIVSCRSGGGCLLSQGEKSNGWRDYPEQKIKTRHHSRVLIPTLSLLIRQNRLALRQPGNAKRDNGDCFEPEDGMEIRQRGIVTAGQVINAHQ